MRQILAFVPFVVAACGNGLSEPSRPAQSAAALRVEPDGPLDAVAPVVHLHVSGPVDLRSLGLFQGALTSYALGRIKAGDLPATVSERQVPSVAYRSLEDVVLAPSRALELGGQYSLASTQGLLGALQVEVSPARARLARVWPPPEGTGHFVYCSQFAGAFPSDSWLLEPGDVAVTPAPGVDESSAFADRCVWFELGRELGSPPLVPPVGFGDWELDPTPLFAPTASAASSLSCSSDELAFGFGCARVDDDRVSVRTPDTVLLWRGSSQAGPFAQVTLAGAPLVIRGLQPDADNPIEAAAYDAVGNVQRVSFVVHTPAAHAHLIVSEVLANPLGPEPASEWVEIVNDGSTSLALGGFEFHDSKGGVALPAAALGAGQYALLVREDFAPGGSDTPPADGTPLLRVPALGSSGLSNTGEAVFLASVGGAVVSRFPALAPRAGESAARRYPWSPDDSPSSFTTGPASPGAANSP